MNYNDFYLLRHANGQMHMNMMIASSVKIINKYNFCLIPIQISQDGFMLRLIYNIMCSLAVICQYSCC